MAYPITAGDYFSVKCWTKAGEQAAVTTMNFVAVSDDSGSLTDQNVADSWDIFFGTDLLPLLANTAEYRGTEVRLLKTPTPSSIFSNVNAGPGTGGAIGAARQVAYLIRFNTVFGGRAYKGRNYLPFPPAAAFAADGAMDAAFVTLLTTYVSVLSGDQYIADSGPATFSTTRQVIVHTATKPPDPPAPLPSIVTAWGLSTSWATQRRRGTFGRANSSPI